MGNQKKLYSKYSVNHNLFKEESERSFYLAGFIAADGCIRIAKTNKARNYINYRLQISLSKNDKDHLEKIKSLLEATNPIYDYEIKNSKRNTKWNDVWESKLLITSKEIVNDLKKFNVKPRKSLTYIFPKWLIKHPLCVHFMRGYFDGDGSFFINSELSYDRLCCSVRGTEKFLKTYKRIMERLGNFKTKSKIQMNDRIGQLSFKGKFAITVRDCLYDNSTIYLDRKYKKSYEI